MMSPQMTRLDELLQQLRLNTVRERLEALLQEASAKELSIRRKLNAESDGS